MARSNLSEELIVNEIDALKDDLRVPFLLHVDGFKYEEIALQLNVPLGTIKEQDFPRATNSSIAINKT